MKRLLFALLVTLVAVPCVAQDWPAYGHDAGHSSKQPLTGTNITPAGVATLHKNWDFFIPAASFRASPSLYHEVVFIGSTHGFFYAIYASGPDQGQQKWRYPPSILPGPIVDACGIIQQPLKLPANQSNTSSGPGIASSAAVVLNQIPGHDQAVIFGAPDPTSNNGDGRLWALDAITGQCIWKSPVIAPAAGNSKIGYSSPAVSNGRAFIGVSARIPDATLAVGKLFAINLADGSLDPNFSFNAANPPSGGGMWGSPAIAPNGNLVVVTGNSCHHFVPPPVACPNAPLVPDYTNSLLELDATSGNVLWQIQPVHIDWDNDPDWAVPPIVSNVSCGQLAMTVQKDGYLHAADIKGAVSSNPACSYVNHNLECPKWSFPNAASLPFMEDGHGDTPFIKPGALDGDWLYITSGGYNLTEMPPANNIGNLPAGRIHFDRLYSFDVCAQSGDRIRWIFESPSGDLGGVSTTNGVLFVGSTTGHVYAIGDPAVAPSNAQVCSYPNLPLAMCAAANFKAVTKPVLLKDIQLQGSIRNTMAIGRGQLYVGTTSGHVYGLVP
jgi:outer membrane protein assembly factor BamB